jgi:phosphoglycolate phosphatase
MNRDYELIVFDWDGTLMDSECKIVSCFRAAAADVGVSDPGTEAIRHIIGLGLNEAVQTLFPNVDDATLEAVVDRYREHFLHIDDTAMPLFSGVEAGLNGLRTQGYLLAVATGKARRGLDRVLKDSGLAAQFAATRCADEAFSKPHPKMLEDLLEQTGVSADRAVMVGDTIYDIQMARNAGVESLAVSYGVHDYEFLASHKPLICLHSFEEVCKWFHLNPDAKSSAIAKN